MMKKILSLALTLVMICGLFGGVPNVQLKVEAAVQSKTVSGFSAPISPPAAGSTPISNRAQLEAVRNDPSGTYHLVANIDLGGAEWIPINLFSGTLDGQGYTINNLYVLTSSNLAYAGLFIFAGNGATIKNLTVNIGSQGISVSTSSGNVGAAGGLIAQCHTNGALITIENCHVNGMISVTGGMAFAGGLIGDATMNSNATSPAIIIIKNSSTTGNINATGSGANAYAGGLLGGRDAVLTVENSYSTSDVFASSTGSHCAGGLVGSSGANSTITNSYATGNVHSSSWVGGLVGVVGYSNNSPEGVNSYRLSTQTVTGQIVNSSGTPLTPDQMRMQSSFEGWDFANVWEFRSGENNGYPVLRTGGGYPVTFNGIGGGTVRATVDGSDITSGAFVHPGKDVFFTPVPNAGYRVKEWRINDGMEYTLTPARNSTFTARSISTPIDITVEFEWIPVIFYEISVSVNNADFGRAEANPVTAERGASVNLTAVANSGYVFDSWEVLSGGVTIDNRNSAATTFTMPADNVSVRAHFKRATYLVTFSVIGGNGTLTASTDSASISTGNFIEHGSRIVFTATPNAGYRVKDWSVNYIAGIIGNPEEIDIFTVASLTRDLHITVEFERTSAPAQYPVTFSVIGGNGTLRAAVDGANILSGAQVEHGKSLVFEATPNAGYKVKGWTVDYGTGGIDNPEITDIITVESLIQPVIITVEFTPTSGTKDNTLIWERDNWRFTNSSSNFSGDYWMADDFYTDLINKLSNTERSTVNVRRCESWGGSCYGMAVTEILAKTDIFSIPNWQSGREFLNQLTKVRRDRNESLINYYQLLQFNSRIQQAIANTIYNQIEREKVMKLIEMSVEVKNGGAPVLLCYFMSGWGGHAVVAYGVEYGSWTWSGVTYGGRILISDPNSSRFVDNMCLYFNTNTYAWTIPNYNLRSASGAYIGLVSDDLSLVNHYGYFSGAAQRGNDMNYISILDFASDSTDFSVRKIRYATDGWISSPTLEDDIKPFHDLRSDNSPTSTKFALRDSASGYEVRLENAEKFDLSMSYENSLFTVKADKGKSAKFEPHGFIELESADSDFEMSMTFNEGHYTLPWYTISAKGRYTNSASMTKAANGIIIRGDNLTDVNVSANSLNLNAEVKFTATYNNQPYTEALIYAIDAFTIGVAVDTDGNGTYETKISESSSAEICKNCKKEPCVCLPGDVNHDGRVNADDLNIVLNNFNKTSNFDPRADVNGDGRVNADDLNIILNNFNRVIRQD